MAAKDARGLRLAGAALVWSILALVAGGVAAGLMRFEHWKPGVQLFRGADGAPLDQLFQATAALHSGLMTLAPTLGFCAAAMGLVASRGGWRFIFLWPARLVFILALLVGLASIAAGLAPLAPVSRPWLTELGFLLELIWRPVYIVAPFLLIAAGVATAPARYWPGVLSRNILAIAALVVAGRWLYLRVDYEMTLEGPGDPWRDFGLAEGVQDGRLHLALFALLMAAAVFLRRGWARDPAAPYAVLGGLLTAIMWFLLLPDISVFLDTAKELAPVHSIYGALLVFIGYAVAFSWVRLSGRPVSALVSWLHATLLAFAVFAMSAPWAILGDIEMPRRVVDVPPEMALWNERASTVAAVVAGAHLIGLLRLILARLRRPVAAPEAARDPREEAPLAQIAGAAAPSAPAAEEPQAPFQEAPVVTAEAEPEAVTAAEPREPENDETYSEPAAAAPELKTADETADDQEEAPEPKKPGAEETGKT